MQTGEPPVVRNKRRVHNSHQQMFAHVADFASSLGKLWVNPFLYAVEYYLYNILDNIYASIIWALICFRFWIFQHLLILIMLWSSFLYNLGSWNCMYWFFEKLFLSHISTP